MKRPTRVNHQNNADLLLSVYELTARSSLQLANQRPRHQSQGRHFPNLFEKGGSPELNIVVSPKKNSVQKPGSSVVRRSQRPQLVLKNHQGTCSTNIISPRYVPSTPVSQTSTNLNDALSVTHNKSAVAIIRAYMKSTNDIMDTIVDFGGHGRPYRFAKQNIDVLLQRLESSEMQINFNLEQVQSNVSMQLDKLKLENEGLRKRMTDLNQDDIRKNISPHVSQLSSFQIQVQQLNEQISKIEKKATSRKICIKKLYQLLEKNERELELYRTGKKSSNKATMIQDNSNKNQSLINKKNELNEILNTVYMKKNKDISIETILLTFIQSVDPKSFELLRSKQNNSSSQTSFENSQVDENSNNKYDQDKINILHQAMKAVKQELYQKRECEQALQNSLQYTLRMIEANQQIWKQAIEEDHVDSMTFEPYIKFMTALGFNKMSQEMNELEKIQSKIQVDTIQWIQKHQSKNSNDNNGFKNELLLKIAQRIEDTIVKYQIEDSSSIDVVQQLNSIIDYLQISIEEYEAIIVNLKQNIEKNKQEFDNKYQQIQRDKLHLIKENEENQLVLTEQFCSLKQTYEDKIRKLGEELRNELSVQQNFQLEQKIEIQNEIMINNQQQIQSLNIKNQETTILIGQIDKEKLYQKNELLILQDTIKTLNQYLLENEQQNTLNLKTLEIEKLNTTKLNNIILQVKNESLNNLFLISKTQESALMQFKQAYQNKLDDLDKQIINLNAKYLLASTQTNSLHKRAEELRVQYISEHKENIIQKQLIVKNTKELEILKNDNIKLSHQVLKDQDEIMFKKREIDEFKCIEIKIKQREQEYLKQQLEINELHQSSHQENQVFKQQQDTILQMTQRISTYKLTIQRFQRQIDEQVLLINGFEEKTRCTQLTILDQQNIILSLSKEKHCIQQQNQLEITELISANSILEQKKNTDHQIETAELKSDLEQAQSINDQTSLEISELKQNIEKSQQASQILEQKLISQQNEITKLNTLLENKDKNEFQTSKKIDQLIFDLELCNNMNENKLLAWQNETKINQEIVNSNHHQEIQNQKQISASLDEQNQDLYSKLKIQKELNDKNQIENHCLTQKINDKQSEIHSLEKINKSQQLLIDEKENQTSQLEDAITEIKNQNSLENQQNAKDAYSQRQQISEQKDTIESQNLQLQAQVSQQIRSNEQIQNQQLIFQQMTQLNKENSFKLETLKIDIIQTKQANSLLLESQIDNQLNLKKQEEKIQYLTNCISEQKLFIENLKQQINHQDGAIQKFDEKCNLEQKKNIDHQIETAELKSDLEKAQSINNQASLEVKELKQNIEKSQQASQIFEQKLISQQNEITKLNTLLENKDKNEFQTSKKIDQLILDLELCNNMNENKLLALQNQTKINQELVNSNHQQEIQNQKQISASLDQQNQDLYSKLKIQKELNDKNQIENHCLTQKINDKQSEIHSLEKINKSQQSLIDEKDNQTTQLQDAITEIKNQNSHQNQQNAKDAYSQRQKISEQIDTIESQNLQLQALKSEQTQIIEQQNLKEQALKLEISQLSTQVTNTSDLLSGSNKKIQTLLEEQIQKELAESLAQLRSQNEQINQELISKLQEEKQSLALMIQELKEQLKVAEEKVRALEDRQEELQPSMEKIEQQNNENLNLAQQLEILKKQNLEINIVVEKNQIQLNESKSQSVYSQALDNLFQELLYNRVNLTSMKQYLSDQQREKLKDFRNKVGEIQIKLISAENLQKSLDNCKFNLTQYQQIVDKSEMRARHFENEFQKKEDELREFKISLENNAMVKKQISRSEQSSNEYIEEDDEMDENICTINDMFLNFSMREEVIYGDKSFFDDLSMIMCNQNYYSLNPQVQELI